VLCEKPLGRDATEARVMLEAARGAGTVAATGFNYRFVPAVQKAREIVASGELGEIVHFRARYLQSWGWDAPPSWRFDRAAAGTGAIGDIGAHSIDIARFLVGEIVAVNAVTRSFVPGREVDDAFAAAVEFESGAIGTLEASRLATGRMNNHAWEINGSKGSLAFDQERMNELLVGDARGFKRTLEHGDWWPPGHIVGYGDTFTYEYLHLLGAIAGRRELAPLGATFEDGYRCAEVCDAIVRSAASGKRVRVTDA
jgi:predicted dehydrogenase